MARDRKLQAEIEKALEILNDMYNGDITNFKSRVDKLIEVVDDVRIELDQAYDELETVIDEVEELYNTYKGLM